MPECQIRLGQPADLPALREVYRRASLSNPSDRAALLAHPEALVLAGDALDHGRTRVAVWAGGPVVGFATTLRVEQILELEDLFVDPDWMRRGIGRHLVQDAVHLATQGGARRIEVTANPDAGTFYADVGFVHDSEVQTLFGPATRMHLAVG